MAEYSAVTKEDIDMLKYDWLTDNVQFRVLAGESKQANETYRT